MKKFTCLIMLLLLFVVTSCASLTDEGMISLEILKDKNIKDITVLELCKKANIITNDVDTDGNPQCDNICAIQRPFEDSRV